MLSFYELFCPGACPLAPDVIVGLDLDNGLLQLTCSANVDQACRLTNTLARVSGARWRDSCLVLFVDRR